MLSYVPEMVLNGSTVFSYMSENVARRGMQSLEAILAFLLAIFKTSRGGG